MKTMINSLMMAALLLVSMEGFGQGDVWVEKNDVGFNQPDGPTAREGAVAFRIGSKIYVGTGYNITYYNDFWEYDTITTAWTRKASFPGHVRAGAVGFGIDTLGYIGTGYYGANGAEYLLDDFWQYSPSTDTWTQKANFPSARWGAVGFGIDSLGYIGTGDTTTSYSGNFGGKRDLWRYSPATNTWVQKANFGGDARYAAAGFSLLGKGYIGTGEDSSIYLTQDFWQYDPIANTWTQKANYGGGGTDGGVGFSTNAYGYIGLGLTHAMYQYDPTSNTWTAKASYPNAARGGCFGVGLSNTGFIGTGTLGGFVYDNSFAQYNEAINQWTARAIYGSIAVDNAIGFSVGSKAYVCKADSTVWAFDQNTGLWTQKNNSPESFSEGAAFNIGAYGYAGSQTGGFWQYDTLSDTWTRKASMPGSRRSNEVSFNINGNGYIGTGYDTLSNLLSDFWEYTPATNTWTQKASMSAGGRRGAVGLGIGSKGYIGLGANTNGALSDFWRYDPISNTWVQETAAGPAASVSASAFAVNGKGYIVGGYPSGGYTLSALWEYDTLTSAWTQRASFGVSAGRFQGVSMSIGGKGYFGTGEASQNNFAVGIYDDFWEYTPAISASAGPDQNICLDNVATMAATGTGTWTALASNPISAIIINPSSPTTTIAGFTIPGVYGFIWAGDTMTVTVHSNTLVVTDSTHVNVSCFNGNNGSICVSVAGGTPNYTYLWSINGNTTACNTALSPGVYTVTVKDNNGCSATQSATITQPASPLQISLTAQNTSCPAGTDGGITTVTTGGTTPYAYAWSPFGFGFTPDLSSLQVGYYCVTVTDGNGCIASGCDSVRAGSGSCLGAGPDRTICENDSVRMAANGSGFWTPLSSNPSTVDIVTSSSPTTLMEGFVSGVYGFIWSGDTVFITALPAPAPLTISQSGSCLGADTLSVQLTTGTDSIGWMLNYNFIQAYNPFYISAAANNTYIPTVAGAYYAYAIGSNGCTSITIDSQIVISCVIGIDSVWPGDADANHIVDNNDLLTIGLAYDSIGPVRTVAQQGIVWQADSANDWSNYFTTYSPSVNFNNADCNGDGIINADDTLAIVTNWGDTHAKTNGMPSAWRSGIPALIAQFSTDTVYNGDTMYVTFLLGSASQPVTDFYGIAFTYNFDPLVVDSTFTSMTYGDSWIGSDTDKISISKVFAAGQIQTAVTRIDHIPVSGSGAFCRASFKITTDNISGKDYSYYTNYGFISGVRLIDQFGNIIPINAGADTSIVAWFANGINEVSTEKVTINPNPAHDKVVISADNMISKISITDVLGQIVMNDSSIGNKSANIDISAYGDGLYIVQVETNRGVGTAKLIIER